MTDHLEVVLSNLQRVKDAHGEGKNVISFIQHELLHDDANSIAAILTSYDLQSGSYVRMAKQAPSRMAAYGGAIADVLNRLPSPDTILEVGCGEATTLSNVLNALTHLPREVWAFDISLSRISTGRPYYDQTLTRRPQKTQFFCADLFHIPLPDSSVDVVYTAHCLEPNGGREEEALRELLRVTSAHLVLFEPSYENNSDAGRERMRKHGYVRNLKNTAEALGYPLDDYYAFPAPSNPLNPTWVHVIKKGTSIRPLTFICPFTGTQLEDTPDSCIAEGLVAYPKVTGIPYLMRSHAILSTNLSR